MTKTSFIFKEYKQVGKNTFSTSAPNRQEILDFVCDRPSMSSVIIFDVLPRFETSNETINEEYKEEIEAAFKLGIRMWKDCDFWDVTWFVDVYHQ